MDLNKLHNAAYEHRYLFFRGQTVNGVTSIEFNTSEHFTGCSIKIAGNTVSISTRKETTVKYGVSTDGAICLIHKYC